MTLIRLIKNDFDVLRVVERITPRREIQDPSVMAAATPSLRRDELCLNSPAAIWVANAFWNRLPRALTHCNCPTIDDLWKKRSAKIIPIFVISVQFSAEK